MNIGVCIKVVPDTDTRIKIADGGNGIDENGIKWIVSPYDAYAVEEGVQAKEKHGGEVVLFSVGPKKWQSNLRSGGLAVGGDRAVMVDDPAMASSDALGIARALAAAIKGEGTEVVFCGKQAADLDNVQVPAMLAELLGWPHVSFVSEFSLDGDTFTATRNVGGGVQEVLSGTLPVVITAERGLNSPRYAKLPAIMKAKRKKIDMKTLADLGPSTDDVAAGAVISSYNTPPARPAGRIIDGDTDTAVNELVRLLREEAKVI